MKNESFGVTIELQGTSSQVETFLDLFEGSIPTLAKLDSLTVTDIAVVAESGFSILESSVADNQSTPVSPDFSICADCLSELKNPNDRRFQYPFINCTNCGPRFTIVEDIPYDRPLTTMKSFLMCEACQREYDDPADRRFHAQPNACPECGPSVWFANNSADEKLTDIQPSSDPRHQTAIEKFRKAIKKGRIVAVKGVGGFHLSCDATNEGAIKELRERKGRVDKPFAVMVLNVEHAQSFCVIGDQERELLESGERPIVLLTKKNNTDSAGKSLQSSVAPGNDFVGVMLPFSPLHYLLIGDSPLVMTSGNLTDEPIARTNDEAIERLGILADCFLLHDREINVVCDDSVVRCVDGQLLPIRRSRGYTPMPITLSESGKSILALGGEIKSTFCVTKDDYAYMSQHIGDMGNVETLEAMRRSVEHFLRLFRVDVKAVAADLHPGYLSGQLAEEFAKTLGIPLIGIQHHFAHVAGLIAEHGLPSDQSIIGCCFDGTGFGTDKTIWGGEILIADGHSYDRFAQLKYVPLPGGDMSVRHPYRMALAQLWSCGLEWNEKLPCVAACPPSERKLIRQQLQKSLNCVPTSSIGRLFDAIASLIGVRHEVNYEAQAAMELETMATLCIDEAIVQTRTYRFAIEKSVLMEFNPSDLISEICKDVLAGVEKKIIAARFHNAVAQLVVDVCVAARDETAINEVGLTGGVFQNVLLLKLANSKLDECGFDVLCHRQVPPNDGGLALGQALIARSRL